MNVDESTELIWYVSGIYRVRSRYLLAVVLGTTNMMFVAVAALSGMCYPHLKVSLPPGQFPSCPPGGAIAEQMGPLPASCGGVGPKGLWLGFQGKIPGISRVRPLYPALTPPSGPFCLLEQQLVSIFRYIMGPRVCSVASSPYISQMVHTCPGWRTLLGTIR